MHRFTNFAPSDYLLTFEATNRADIGTIRCLQFRASIEKHSAGILALFCSAEWVRSHLRGIPTRGPIFCLPAGLEFDSTFPGNSELTCAQTLPMASTVCRGTFPSEKPSDGVSPSA